MGFQDLWAVVIIIVAGFCFQAQVLKSQNLSCNPDDLAALRDFSSKLEPGIYVWWANSNSSSDCCNWVGITCNSSSSLGLNDTTNDSSSGRVTRLVLDRKRLTGKLSESLGKLVQLRFLNLSHNFLKNSVPESLFHLPNLEVLDLSFNDLSGPIPQTINLPSIQHLDISSNLLNGSLPTRICENSTRIRVIRLAVNYFSGDFSLGLGNCVFLEHLCLGMNDLTGNIAEDIFRLPKLNLLGLQDNKFSGQLSSSISLLTSLVRLDVSTNNFSGRIPDVFSNLNHFKDLVAHSNQFVGKIPTSLSNSPTVNLINLRNNSLDGSLELNCSAMTNLTSLHLGTNRFNGSLPSNLSSCRQLKNINLARNNFTGQIPETFRNFHSLSYLSLSNCSFFNLSSALQILQECKTLTTLVLTKNFPNEELPADPSLHFENLKVLVIASCKLKGSIPQWLKGCTKLQLLDLSWNHLGATIPAWIGQFQDLFYLDLSNNTFTGEIPKSITGLASLINRSISLEEPSSDFPFFMKRNESARGLQYNQIWSFPPTVELGHNLLTGPIWPEFGNLKKLHVLDLKFNNLSGTIPTELSGMTSLEMLDLSHNDLTGNIPPLLVKLSFLSRFSVAHNQLSGKIPWEGQFATFPNSSFEDNKLCGDHRFPCQSDQVPVRSPGKPRRNKDIIAGMVVGIVFGIAFLVVLMFMILSRARSRGGEVDAEKEEADINDKDLGELRSRLILPYDTHVTTDLVGTLGYIPPEYGQSSVATYKGDVYSFGVVLLELLTGKRPIDMCKPKGSRDLISWVIRMKKENRESEVLDPFIYDKQHDKEMLRVLEIACLCLSSSPKVRPTTQQLVSSLDNIDTDI
ncbi:hypothetical protein Q3G72_033911 [Acer saccharum]|nr:hypothetical protein Q3G72_033911 [Acer saccharum]